MDLLIFMVQLNWLEILRILKFNACGSCLEDSLITRLSAVEQGKKVNASSFLASFIFSGWLSKQQVFQLKSVELNVKRNLQEKCFQAV